MKTSDVFSAATGYLKAEDLQGKAVRVTIESVTAKEFQEDDGRMVKKLILHFVNQDKALVCNRTNAATVEMVTASDETDDWVGWKIVLYVTRVPYGNKMVPAIRINDRPGSAVKPERLQRREAVKPPPASPPPVYEREPGDDLDDPRDATPDLTDEDIRF